MAQPLCRWGILGTAHIARKNWLAIRHSGNSALVAVASREEARARRFIEECQAEAPLTPPPLACGSYEELIQRGDIDAVYIPLPTVVRKEWVIRAAEAGKHVLCEKPCGVTSDDVRAMLDACRRHRVHFMDGVMFMHSRRLPLLRQVLDDSQTIGTVRRVASQFSFSASDDFLTGNIRSSSDLEPLGCLGDLGWYNVRFALWVLGEQQPRARHGPNPRPARPAGPATGADRVCRRAVLSGKRQRLVLLLVPDGKPAMGQRERHTGLPARSRLRAAVLGLRDDLRGEQACVPRPRLRFQHGKPPPAVRGPRIQQQHA